MSKCEKLVGKENDYCPIVFSHKDYATINQFSQFIGENSIQRAILKAIDIAMNRKYDCTVCYDGQSITYKEYKGQKVRFCPACGRRLANE